MYVWVKDPSIAGSDLFTKGHILNINANKITVETSNSQKTQELIVPAADLSHICPEGDVPDHCQLMFLSQPTMLENTKKRFAADKIYTLVGDILIAVNPFKWISGIYGVEMMQQCKGRKLYNCPCGPHVYGTAEKVMPAAPPGRAASRTRRPALLWPPLAAALAPDAARAHAPAAPAVVRRRTRR